MTKRARAGLLRTAMLIGAWWLAAAGEARGQAQTFTAARAGEAVAVVRAEVPGCSWELRGAEAAVLRIELDGRYSQHLPLVRGGEPGEYRVALGHVDAGPHVLQATRDDRASAPPCVPRVAGVSFEVLDDAQPGSMATALAPILHVRPGTLERFSDLPILAYVETEPAQDGSVEFRYTVVFTNEDGGTPADKLMATWGRTTDIEFVYGVRVDAQGRVRSTEIQGPDHKVLPFTGRHEARHPLLWVTTDNNMVEASGTTDVRIVPAFDRLDLGGRPRETIMDLHPWSYSVMAAELAREGKIAADAAPGSGRIPPFSTFVFVDACATVVNAALALSVGVGDGAGGMAWFDVDRGMPEFRMTRSGCNRVAVPVARETPRVRSVRARVFERSRPESEEARAVLNGVSVFALDDRGEPRVPPSSWHGVQALSPGTAWSELRLDP